MSSQAPSTAVILLTAVISAAPAAPVVSTAAAFNFSISILRDNGAEEAGGLAPALVLTSGPAPFVTRVATGT